jgi:GTP pyrophosphokinase
MYGTRPPSSITNELLWSRLEPLLWYLPSDHEREQVAAALQLAAQAHAGQMRKSGEPFITHPVEVTRILAEMRADAESLIAGLLHDTVEDTECISFDDIEARFGTSVRRIVEGETKISKITRASPDADDKAKDLQVRWECSQQKGRSSTCCLSG